MLRAAGAERPSRAQAPRMQGRDSGAGPEPDERPLGSAGRDRGGDRCGRLPAPATGASSTNRDSSPSHRKASMRKAKPPDTIRQGFAPPRGGSAPIWISINSSPACYARQRSKAGVRRGKISRNAERADREEIRSGRPLRPAPSSRGSWGEESKFHGITGVDCFGRLSHYFRLCRWRHRPEAPYCASERRAPDRARDMIGAMTGRRQAWRLI